MKNRRITIVAFLLIAALTLGFGYAAVTNVLDIQGSASVSATAAEADPVVNKLDDVQIEKMIERARNQMLEASKKLDFVAAAQYRDEMLKLQDVIDSRSNK